jgi:5-methylcytosine-specific restriction protein B
MNTADRSIALLDAALRRRFCFIPFFPDKPPIEGLLRRWLQQNKPHLEWIADAVDRANAQLGDRNVGIGPSYFMRGNLSEEWIELIWEHAITPYLAEQFFGEEDRLGEFELARLRFGEPEDLETDTQGVPLHQPYEAP